MHVNMSKSHRQRELSSVLAIFCFACVSRCGGASCLAEMIMWRQNTRFASPACSEHQMFSLTFLAELPKHRKQVPVGPRAEGQIYMEVLHLNKLLQIQPLPASAAVMASAAGRNAPVSPGTL